MAADIRSPNTVIANALDATLDLLQPRIKMGNHGKVEFCVGTQINGKPHLGTYMVLTGAFVLARNVRERYGLPVKVKFGALDNAPYEVVQSPDGIPYQRTFGHAMGFVDLIDLIHNYYIDYMNRLSDLTDVRYEWSTYVSTQQTPSFRRQFMRVLDHYDQLRWVTSPSQGDMRIRIPCPQCGYAEKYAAKTEVTYRDGTRATIRSFCFNHGWYDSEVLVSGKDNTYLDLNTLVRNAVKEAEAAERKDVLSVMVKGGDWVLSCQLVDWAIGVLGYTSDISPMRFFTPEVVTPTGAKLSKSLIREGDNSLNDVPPWVLDMGLFAERFSCDYAERMVWLLEQFMSNPRHIFRAYTYQEVIRLLESYGR